MDETRRCYRLVGGVLCERTVKDVLPELTANKDQLENMVTMGGEHLSKKGLEINKYIEVHNIRVKGADDSGPQAEVAPEPSPAERKQLLVTN